MPNTSHKTYQKTQSSGHVIKEEIRKYFRYWPFILGAVIIAVAIVFVHLRYTKNQYKSYAKIRILSSNPESELPQAGFIFKRTNINLENNIEILKSSKLWQEVVVELNLVTSFYEDGNVLLTEVLNVPFKFELRVPITEITREQNYNLDTCTVRK